jgi:hypothetical protein
MALHLRLMWSLFLYSLGQTASTHKLRMAVINVYFCLYEVSDAVLSWCRLGWRMGI